jgi:probable addiction module antidote protein
MALETTPFDPAEYLDSDEAIAAYLTDALETADPAFVADALGVIARAKGMAQIAEQAGLSRESLYRTLSARGNPQFGTVMKVIAALGLQLSAQSVAHPAE